MMTTGGRPALSLVLVQGDEVVGGSGRTTTPAVMGAEPPGAAQRPHLPARGDVDPHRAADPGPTPVVVDAYVVVRLPDGSFLSLRLGGGVVAGVVPIGRGLAPFAFTEELLRYTFRGDEPPGQYTWFGALTEPGTLNVVSPLDQVPFTFSP
jgi:hypothetical protein